MKNPRKDNKSGGECCVQNGDGTFSDYPLQEQMVEGVDDSHFRAQTRAELHARGIPAAALNGLFPDLTPLPEE
jgi:hypothetical protein